jgi:hypothetical protein
MTEQSVPLNAVLNDLRIPSEYYNESDALEWAAGDEGKGSPAYLEGEGGKAAGERMTLVAADTDEAK